MWEYKQVIVIPEDVELSPGKLGVQVAHASITPILKNLDHLGDIKEWFDKGTQYFCTSCCKTRKHTGRCRTYTAQDLWKDPCSAA
ncbi:peptidyl-tRNA hydrolase [Methanolobus sp. WCC1]|jgi:peptidyl-tRNA hydrolase|uniref:peptidyl-tRNA hydrolase n=1 Tax=Methanosarcinaceae TaxID=2206 RepID=UPI001AE23102|nr:peptidyl-tRNA hydrolase [Methanolobus bombayensis]